MEQPSLEDILKARQNISRYLRPTPFRQIPPLGKMLGCELYLKFECMQPTGAFKVRGGLNLLANMTPQERARGVMTASTGNHGLSVAFAASRFGASALIACPHGSNPDKVRAIRELGAEVKLVGKDFDEAREWAEGEALARGSRYIHPANEPLLIAGVGTEGLEIMEDLPDVELFIIPVGGGSGVSGCAVAAKAINPRVEVIGVQAERAPAVYLSYRTGQMVECASSDTFAEGLATRVPFELTFGIIMDLVDDMVLVSEEEMEAGIRLLLREVHVLAEGAGAAPVAAAFKLKERLEGKKVAAILSGGNLTIEKLREILTKKPLLEFS